MRLAQWRQYIPPPCNGAAGVPASHRVPGCEKKGFVVDRFSSAAQRWGAHFFLTHFHADHYGGLGKKFGAGTVYCTRETARLVRMKLRVGAASLCCARAANDANIVQSQGPGSVACRARVIRDPSLVCRCSRTSSKSWTLAGPSTSADVS